MGVDDLSGLRFESGAARNPGDSIAIHDYGCVGLDFAVHGVDNFGVGSISVTAEISRLGPASVSTTRLCWSNRSIPDRGTVGPRTLDCMSSVAREN
jgi:hypothetical protein